MDRNKEFNTPSVHRPEKPQKPHDNKKIGKKSLGEQLIEWVDQIMPPRW